MGAGKESRREERLLDLLKDVSREEEGQESHLEGGGGLRWEEERERWNKGGREERKEIQNQAKKHKMAEVTQSPVLRYFQRNREEL